MKSEREEIIADDLTYMKVIEKQNMGRYKVKGQGK